MVATTLLRVSMELLVNRLRLDYPDLLFTVGASNCWSPIGNEIFYTDDERDGMASLLHEIGHARLKHTNFGSDVELLQKEVDAWQEALRLANYYSVYIDNDHVEGCLDSYRDWLFKRSRCPICKATGIQTTVQDYRCLNCNGQWHVTSARMRRPYRRLATKKEG